MRILYLASGIPVPGALGGSTHTYEVARGLARLGHEVHLVCASHEGWAGLAPFARPVSSLHDGFHLHQQDVPKAMALLGLWPVLRLARAIQPDVIIERYYNFAGCGVIAARCMGLPYLLEVNALIIDPPQVRKRRIDDALGGPLRRWATAQCRWAARIVTPLHTTVPPEIPREKIVELPWGADVERFTTIADCRLQIAEPQSAICNLQSAIFLGSFRTWHGVLDFVRAGLRLVEQGRAVRFVLVGDGPERAAAEALAATARDHFEFTGAVPYDRIPALLAEAAIGVAPFVTAPHPALRAAGFFWSPLKIFEYMAAGLPVVTPDIAPLNQIIGHGREGLLYPEGNVAALAEAIGHLLDDPQAAQAMGRSARARVVAHYSWQRHCAALDSLLREMVEA